MSLFRCTWGAWDICGIIAYGAVGCRDLQVVNLRQT